VRNQILLFFFPFRCAALPVLAVAAAETTGSQKDKDAEQRKAVSDKKEIVEIGYS
jgi:hypothetical protein